MCQHNKYSSFYILLVMHSVINKHFSSGTDSSSSWLWRSWSWNFPPLPLPSAARRMQPYTVFCVLIWLQLDHHTQCSIFNQLPYILLLFPINFMRVTCTVLLPQCGNLTQLHLGSLGPDCPHSLHPHTARWHRPFHSIAHGSRGISQLIYPRAAPQPVPFLKHCSPTGCTMRTYNPLCNLLGRNHHQH